MPEQIKHKTKKKFTDTLAVVKFSSAKMPEFKEVTGKDWIYYGEKNNYPQYLLDLYYKCSKHNAIVNGKAKYIAGAGWMDGGDVVINSDGETLNPFTHKCVLDDEINNGYAIEVIWDNAGKNAEFRHIDWSGVRSNADNTKFYYTKKWCRSDGYPVMDPTQNEDWEVYSPFNPEKPHGKQLLYYKCYSPGLDVYPLPEYKASLLYIELEYQIANYWFNRVKNGFMPSAILNFYMGQPSDDEMKKIEEKVKAKFAGTDNAGGLVMNFASGKDFAADVQQLNPPELGEQYEALNTTLQTEIFTGHGVTNGMLFGIKEPGQLGGRTELIEANELFQNRYVSPKQLAKEQFFAKYIFPYVKELAGKKEMKLKKQEPIGYMFSESIMVKYLPERAIAEMVAAKMGIELKNYHEYDKEQKDKKAAEAQKGQQFSDEKEKHILCELKKRGKKRKGKVLKRIPVTYEMSRDLKASEEAIRMEFDKKPPKIPIIIGNPVGGTPPGPSARPTEIITVVYGYDWIPGFDDSNLDTSREFCADLISATRAGVRWTREDIEDISTAGYPDSWGDDPDIWAMRGGWYTKPGTDIRVPHCRHQWMQEILRETVE